MEAAIDRIEEAETLTQISKDRGTVLETQLTEQMAVAAEKDAKLADMEAQLTAAKKTIADAETRRDSSDGDGGIAVGDGSGEILPTGLKANLTIHVHAIFKNIKFINDATLKAIPQIMEHTFEAMEITSRLEQEKYKDVVKKELKYLMSQRRAYFKKRVMGQYKGK